MHFIQRMHKNPWTADPAALVAISPNPLLRIGHTPNKMKYVHLFLMLPYEASVAHIESAYLRHVKT